MNSTRRGKTGISRRSFLRASTLGATSLTLGLSTLSCVDEAGEGEEVVARPAGRRYSPPPIYDDWRDVYRERWRWDKVVRSTHFVNCWYQAACSWNVYVKDGIVWREEQVAEYEQTNADVPDANPRGCQKGGCFSERMYDAGRLRYPLKRVGERGSGKWKRVSWDEALDEVADSMLDTLRDEGSDRIIWELGPLYTLGTQTAGHQRLSLLLDSTNLDMNNEIGDGHPGAAETFGKIVFERSADDYFNSDLILIWGANPLYTQIPNAHFLTEARYSGAKLVCIAPDYSASSIHADLYVPVKPGGDAALGLGVAQVLIEEELIDRDFLVEQTDLPLLVRDDTHRYLRAADMESGGSEEEFYSYREDAEGQTIVPSNKRTLELDGVRPELEGHFDVRLANGEEVSVQTVFSLLKERLADYTPEKASALCGTPPGVIRDLARRFAAAKAASMVTTSNFGKYYHGNLIERTQALVFALTGNYGKKGSGFVAFPFLATDGIEHFVREMFSLKDMLNSEAVKVVGGMALNRARWKLEGYTDEMIAYEQGHDLVADGMMASGSLFWYIHGGLLEASADHPEWDPYLKRPIREILEESLEKGWQHVWPKPGNDPRVMFVYGSNPLRRVRSYPLILKHLWPKLQMIVTLDMRMTSTAMQSDYVLPASAWYERDEHKWGTPLMPYIHGGEKAASYYESKSDWWIVSSLAAAVDRRAKARGMTSFVDRKGNTRPLDNLLEKYSSGGKYGPDDDAKVCSALLEHSTNAGGVTWDELKKKGFHRLTGIGTSSGCVGNATQFGPDETITPLTDHVFEKLPYPTMTRRMQFYIDQEIYLEMGEELPVHKDPPSAGGDYPLTVTGGHTRWSIHSAWQDDRLMLQQQRGEPLVLIGPEDAEARGVKDGAQVRVYNDLDSFQIMAKVTPGVRRSQLIIYHAWENFQFEGGKGFQNLMPTPLNPVDLAGGYFHLRPGVITRQPNHSDRDTRVEVVAL